MISFIFVYLCSVLMVTTSSSKVGDIFELEMDQQFGILGCRKQCENRKACVDVKYSPYKMTCVLKINTSSIIRGDTDKGTGFCVQRTVRARSGGIVTVCKLYDDLLPIADQIKYEETKLSFISESKDLCIVSGKQNNIVETKPGAAWESTCKARIDKIFLRNATYSFSMNVSETNNDYSKVKFVFQSTLGKVVSRYTLTKSDRCFQFEYNHVYTFMSCKSTAMLRFTLSNGTMHVIDLGGNVSKTYTLGAVTGHKFWPSLLINLEEIHDFKMILNECRTAVSD